MCTRYALSSPLDLLRKLFGFESGEAAEPCHNVAPGTEILALRTGAGGHREAIPMLWGLQGRTRSTPIVNVRSETAASHPLFREAVLARRALVPADGFFEWRHAGAIREPWYFQRPDQEPFGLAALFDEQGRCALLTMPASPEVAPIHDRMPVILGAAEAGLWMDGAGHSMANALKACGGIRLQRRPIDSAVNNVRRDGPDLLHPPRQGTLL